MKRLFLLLVVGLVMLVGVLPVAGQDSTVIEYGQVVSGEITDSAFEVTYTFTGQAGDIVLITMEAVDTMSDMDYPSVLLLDGENTVLATHDDLWDARIVVTLPDDGEYIVLATRRDGRGGDSVGEYNLKLTHLPVLTSGEVMTGKASSNQVIYYAVTEQSFMLNFSRSGDFAPAVIVHTIDEGTLQDSATLHGDTLVELTASFEYSDESPVIIEISEAVFDFNFNEVSGEYSIGIE